MRPLVMPLACALLMVTPLATADPFIGGVGTPEGGHFFVAYGGAALFLNWRTDASLSALPVVRALVCGSEDACHPVEIAP